MKRERDERYATADEMRLDLEAYLRARTDIASERDLAKLMNDMFAQLRDSVRAQIKAYVSSISVARLPSAPGITGTGTLPVLPGFSGPPGPLEISSSSSASSLSSSLSSRSDPRGESISVTPPRRSRWPLVLVAVIPFVAVVGVGLFVLRAPHAAAGIPSPATASAPTPPLSAPAPPVANAKVHVSVATSPGGAHIEWNGEVFGPTPTAFAIDPGQQSLRVSRDGFEPSVITIDGKAGEELSRTVTLRAVAETAGSGSSPAGSPPSWHHVRPGAGRPVVAAPTPVPTPTPAPSASTPQRPNIKMLDESEAQ